MVECNVETRTRMMDETVRRAKEARNVTTASRIFKALHQDREFIKALEICQCDKCVTDRVYAKLEE